MHHEECLASSVLEFIHLHIWAEDNYGCVFSPCFLMPFFPEAKYSCFHLLYIHRLWFESQERWLRLWRGRYRVDLGNSTPLLTSSEKYRLWSSSVGDPTFFSGFRNDCILEDPEVTWLHSAYLAVFIKVDITSHCTKIIYKWLIASHMSLFV